jgi:hypothetical protein
VFAVEKPTLTQTGSQAGVIPGTVAYTSPELTRGIVAGKRADEWSFRVRPDICSWLRISHPRLPKENRCRAIAPRGQEFDR